MSDRFPEPLHMVEGTVEHGDERGRLLGFPTANLLDVGGVRLDGVYAGLAQVEPGRAGPTFVAAVSVGHRPTYYGGAGVRLMEAHLLDVTDDLYGRTLRVELHVRLRPQHAYVDTATLVRQLHLDVAATRAWAEANRLDEFLDPGRGAQGPPGNGRAGFPRRRRPPRADVAADRASRREARLLAAIDRATAEVALTHERVVELSGLPLGYVLWRYPVLRDRCGRQGHDAR